MTIRSFTFHDKISGWRLEETSFGPVNLLVGASGVGKTKILESLRRVAGMARSLGAPRPPEVIGNWHLRVSIDDKMHEWVSKTEYAEPECDDDWHTSRREVHYVREEIRVEGKRRYHREFSKLLTPSSDTDLNSAESMLHLLQSDVIQGLSSQLDRFYFEDRQRAMALSMGQLDRLPARSAPLHVIGTFHEFIERLFLLKRDHPEVFGDVKERFLGIFRFVDDIDVNAWSKWQPDSQWGQYYTVGIREKGQPKWIVGWDISAGMVRALVFLVDIFVAPKGTVFFIDEIENSLGNNCLSEVVGLIWERAGDLQFIITTHHPYVINNIPLESWKIVTRKRALVSARGADEFAPLRSASRLTRFTKLLNLPEFEEGIEPELKEDMA